MAGPIIPRHTYKLFRGVCIILAISLAAEILQVNTDPDRRFIILILRIASVTFTLINISIPPPFSVEVLSKLSLQLLSRPPGPLLYVGDFNAILDLARDRLGGGGRSSPSFVDWAQVYDLTEVWRWKHLDVCQYSCHSDSFHTMSWIDLPFATRDTLPIVSVVSYLLLPGSGPAIWHLNSYWLEDEVVQEESRKGIVGYWKDNLGIVDASTEWEAFKTMLRGTFMSIKGVIRQNNRQRTEELETAMLTAESAYATNPNFDTRNEWLQSRREYELRLLDHTQKRMLHTTQKVFEHGNKAGRLLA